jgi:uncharacterized membrane protein
MTAINRATDHGQQRRFKWLHDLSVIITLATGVARKPLNGGHNAFAFSQA